MTRGRSGECTELDVCCGVAYLVRRVRGWLAVCVDVRAVICVVLYSPLGE